MSTFTRRRLIVACGAFGVICAAPRSRTQPATARIGFLSPTRRPPTEAAFWDELRRLGYVEGRNIVVEYRSADGDFGRLAELARDLVRHDVDIIAAYVTQASLAAKAATSTIPIVMIAVSDPVGSGLVRTLGRPGGNVTGTSAITSGVAGKQLELLRDLRHDARNVAVLWNPSNRVFQAQQLSEIRAAAAKLRIQLQLFEAQRPEDLEKTFLKIREARADALLATGDPMLVSQASRIADLAVRHRIAAVSAARAYAEAGLLATYGPDFSDAYRRAANYVDRILKGAKPADLPVEQSTKFELLINARTARALGIAFPQTLIARADQIIE
jgi:putative ABC transport system substrate-binding protein